MVFERPSNQWFEGPGTAVAISPAGQWALFSPWDQATRLFSLKSGKEEPQRVGVGLDSFAESGVFCGKENFAWLGKRGASHGWFLSRGKDLVPTSVPDDATLRCSSDGSQIAYWFSDKPAGVFVGPDGKYANHPLNGVVTGAAFSPDGKDLYASVFRPDGVTFVARITLGKPGHATIADGLDAAAPWTNSNLAVAPDGHSLFIELVGDARSDNEARHRPASDRWLKIYQLNVATGARRFIAGSPGQDNSRPSVADGRLYWTRNVYHSAITVLPVGGGEAKELIADGEQPTWRPDGRQISYVVGGFRMADWALNLDSAAIPVNPQGQRAGEPSVIISGYYEDFAAIWSPDGRWIAFHSHRPKTPVAAYDSAGSADDIFLRRADDLHAPEIRLTDFGLEVWSPSWSPDGRKLMFTSWEKGGKAGIARLWILSLDPLTGKVFKTEKLPLPEGIANVNNGAWSPDGREIAIEAFHAGEDRSLWIVDAAGAHGQKLFDYKGSSHNGLDWAADGKQIIYSALVDGKTQLFAVPRAGGVPRQLSHDSGNLMHPRVSPDGRWIACTRIVQSQQIWRRPLVDGAAPVR
jgi:WD40 repeat protein